MQSGRYCPGPHLPVSTQNEWRFSSDSSHCTSSDSLWCVLFAFFNENYQRRQWHPTPVLWPGKSHGRRSLVGCSPWGSEESDTTEWLHFHPLGKEMATHTSVLAWRIPGMGEPGGLLSGVAQSWTQLKWLSSSSSSCLWGELCETAILWLESKTNDLSLWELGSFTQIFAFCYFSIDLYTFYNN